MRLRLVLVRPVLAMSALLVMSGCDGHKLAAGNAVADMPDSHARTRIAVRVEPQGRGAVRLDAELALDEDAQEKGLSGRATIAPDTAMLFPMFPPRTASFWMKDTRAPLDMLFIRTDGRIALIARNAKPGDLTPVSTGFPVAGVLELAGGRAAALGLREGDRIGWGNCLTGAHPDEAWDSLSFCPR